MSASSKKKLRHAADAAKLTERQIQEQKEAKKLNLYTTLFVVVLAVLLVVALTVGTISTVKSSGIRERSTTALTVGNHEISNAELNYFYIDAINNFLNQYGDIASLMGLDAGKPLNEQVVSEESGTTWADDFLNSAKESAKSIYALVDAAEAEGFTLSEEDKAQADVIADGMDLYAAMYGYGDGEAYLKAMYGNGATMESFREYCYNSVLANAYYAHHAEGLTYEDSDLRAKEAENPLAYSSYSFNYYYVSASKFLEGGTTDDEGNTTYSDEEKAASVAAAEEAAKGLIADSVNSVEAFDKLISAMDINAETEVKSTACDNYSGTSILATLSDWVTDEARTEGDKTCIASTSTTTDEDGNETVTTNGYYVVFFRSSTDNTFPMVNARHILVSFEGGTTDSTTGVTTYTEEEKAAAWTAAEEILESWKSGEATEESFAALANEKSTDTGSNTNGGLYENIYPGQMVEPFEDWCYGDRKAGDTGLVETEYGVHIMYYVGESEQTYRDFMITNTLVSADAQAWYDALVEAVSTTDGNTKYIDKTLVISAK